MHYRSRPQPSASRFSALFVVGILLMAAALMAGFYVALRMMRAPHPQIVWAKPVKVIGRNAQVDVKAADRTGLRSFKVTLSQAGQDEVLVDDTYDPPRPEAELHWSPAQEKRFKLKEGAGKLHVEARNASWGNFFKGRTASSDQEFTVRLTAPRVEVLTGQHYVNQGGCDMVVYRVTPAGTEHGVLVGDHFYPGFPVPGAKDPSVQFAIFALPYDIDPATPIKVRARDDAGNEAQAGFWLKVFPRKWKASLIKIDDTFLNRVVPAIMNETPSLQDKGSLIANFLQINRDLRKEDNRRLADLAAQSRHEMLWHEPFVLGNISVEASFADHRTYEYQGKEVDQQDHLGFDLATTMHAPVPAANDGVVAMAEYLGIYGNCIVIDHGFGLMTVYGHLNDYAVKVGEAVKRGQTIAHTDTTGLAAGDHLHYSVLLGDTQVQPREWWDPHWLHDRILAKLEMFGAGGGGAEPGAVAAPAEPAPTRHPPAPAGKPKSGRKRH